MQKPPTVIHTLYVIIFFDQTIGISYFYSRIRLIRGVTAKPCPWKMPAVLLAPSNHGHRSPARPAGKTSERWRRLQRARRRETNERGWRRKDVRRRRIEKPGRKKMYRLKVNGARRRRRWARRRLRGTAGVKCIGTGCFPTKVSSSYYYFFFRFIFFLPSSSSFVKPNNAHHHARCYVAIVVRTSFSPTAARRTCGVSGT